MPHLADDKSPRQRLYLQHWRSRPPALCRAGWPAAIYRMGGGNRPIFWSRCRRLAARRSGPAMLGQNPGALGPASARRQVKEPARAAHLEAVGPDSKTPAQLSCLPTRYQMQN